MIIYKVSNAGARYPRTFTALCSLFSPNFSLQISIKTRAHKTNILFRSQDIITGDEIISDTYELKEIDDAVYQVDCKRVTRGVDNIGLLSTRPSGLPSSEFDKRRLTAVALHIDIGANPSTEEAEDGVEDTGKQVIDVVDGFRLNYLGDEASGSRAFNTQKEYLTQLKSTLWTFPIPHWPDSASPPGIRRKTPARRGRGAFFSLCAA